MNPSFLERKLRLSATLILAVMISGIIPTIAHAQSTQSSDYSSAAAQQQARLNGSITQSAFNGASSGMRLLRSQSVDSNQNQNGSPVSDNNGSLFSSNSLSNFGTASGAAATPAAVSRPVSFSAPATSAGQSPATSSANQNDGQSGSFDFGKALSIGTTLFNGYNKLMNDSRPPLTSMLNGNAYSNSSMGGPTQMASSLLNKLRPLNRNEINLLSNYDVALIIDKSGSMQTRDCPGGLSRWDFCREQLLNLTGQINTAFRNGITVALFSSGYDIFNNVNFAMVPQIFATNSPDGGTYLANPLREILGNFFRMRNGNMASNTPTRPLLIEVITDGEPSDKQALVETICDATKQMSSPNEVSIQFLQIGHETEGSRVLNQLDNGLVGNGAQFDIVNVEPFDAILNEGLARSLVDSATRHPN